MPADLRFTLLPEGTSDRALMPILDWLLAQHFSAEYWTIVGTMVQRDRLPAERVASLGDRIKTAADVYPCEILFVHRDEDGQTIAHRESAIRNAVQLADLADTVAPIAVIPIRMTEAWLLIDEPAVRKAAGFTNGTVALDLPSLAEIERRADPKTILMKALRKASGRAGRKLRTLNLNEARSMIASYITDLSRLRSLPSFQYLERSVEAEERRRR